MKILSRLIIVTCTVLVIFIYNLAETNSYDVAVNSNLTDNSIKLPIIMYHSFLKDTNTHGKFVISPDQLDNDMKYLTDNGYTSISVSDLIEYTKGNIKLPEKIIMITIDDGYYNNYLYAFPILKKYNMKAVISPIIKYSELYSNHDENNAYYSHITWAQGKEMAESGLVEFQNHTYDMHSMEGERKGIRKLPGESVESYQKKLYADLYNAHHLICDKFGCTPQAIAFPFGAYTNDANTVINELGYKVSFSSVEGINTLSSTSALFNLKRYNRPHGLSSAEYFSKILNN